MVFEKRATIFVVSTLFSHINLSMVVLNFLMKNMDGQLRTELIAGKCKNTSQILKGTAELGDEIRIRLSCQNYSTELLFDKNLLPSLKTEILAKGIFFGFVLFLENYVT